MIDLPSKLVSAQLHIPIHIDDLLYDILLYDVVDSETHVVLEHRLYNSNKERVFSFLFHVLKYSNGQSQTVLSVIPPS